MQAASAQPAFGTLGDLGRSSVQGPDFWEIDMSLTRGFRIRESMRMEFRLDAFNVTNSFRAVRVLTTTAAGGTSGVTTTVNSAQFGQILTAQDPRILQVAGKLVASKRRLCLIEMQATDLPAKTEDAHCGPAAGPTNGIRMACTHETMTSFARILLQIGGWDAAGKRIVDRTGLQGAWGFPSSGRRRSRPTSPITEA